MDIRLSRRQPLSAGSASEPVADARLRRIVQIAAATTLIVYWLLLAVGSSSRWLTHWGFLAMLVVSTALIAVRALVISEARRAWILLTIGLASWTTGWAVYLGADASGRVLPSPGAVDVLWLSLYPFALAALVSLGRRISGVRSVLAIDVVTIMLMTAGVVTAVVLPHLLASEQLVGLERVVVISYQVGDCILGSFVVVAVAVAARRSSAVWVLLAAAIVTLGIGDAAWSFQVASGPLPAVMDSNAIFPLTMALFVAAAWQPAGKHTFRLSGAEVRIQVAFVVVVILGTVLLAANEWIVVPAVSVVLVAFGLAVAMHRIWRAMFASLRSTWSAAREREHVDEVREALAAGELDLHYQHIVDLRSGAVQGAEALLRWGSRRPDEFLPAVERSALIRPVTDFVLERAIAAAAGWRAAGHDIGISVNLATANLSEADLPDRVTSVLHRHRLPTACLTLEITETAAVDDSSVVDDVLAAIEAAGVALSIDDFGTGHSSIARIARFPISEIKIDRSFVHDMNHAKLPIVAASIALASGLGLSVVAEGIEDLETMDRLIDLGCDSGQGYFISRPIDRDAFVRWLADRSMAQAQPRAPAPAT